MCINTEYSDPVTTNLHANVLTVTIDTVNRRLSQITQHLIRQLSQLPLLAVIRTNDNIVRMTGHTETIIWP